LKPNITQNYQDFKEELKPTDAFYMYRFRPIIKYTHVQFPIIQKIRTSKVTMPQ
jgi:hypothetical protein